MLSAWRGLTLGIAAGALLGGAGAADATVYLPGYDGYHRDLAHDRSVFDSVGQVTLYDQNDNYAGRGSGVLINRRWVLTAAHVVEGAGARRVVFERGDYGDPIPTQPVHGYHPIPGGDVSYSGRIDYDGRNWYTPKQYNGNIVHGFDIALIDLGANAISGPVRVPKLPPAGRKVGYGRKIDMVGYGTWGATTNFNGGEIQRIDGSEADYRRAGSNILDGKLSNFVPIYPNPQSGPGQPAYLPVAPHITAYDFDAGARGQPLFDDGVFNRNDFPILGEASSSQGDSGGGIFYGDSLIGLVSGGYSINSPTVGYNTLAFNTEVAAFTNWIRRVMRAVQTGDRSQPWLFRENNFQNPLIIGGGDVAEQRLGYSRFDVGPVIPEPTTALLLTAAAGMLLGRRNRQ